MCANNSEDERALDSNFLWILEHAQTHKGGMARAVLCLAVLSRPLLCWAAPAPHRPTEPTRCAGM